MTTLQAPSKALLLEVIEKFIAQRSGIDRRNYQRDWRDTAGAAAFNADYREILRDGRDARQLLQFIAGRDGIPAENIFGASSRNGRLEWVFRGDKIGLDYCTGQYFPTEYRAAACSMLAAIVWRYLCDGIEDNAADHARKAARRLFGRGLASRWFA